MQRKIELEKEKDRVHAAITQSSSSLPNASGPKDKTKHPPGTTIDFRKYLIGEGYVSVPRDIYLRLSQECRNKIKEHNKNNRKRKLDFQNSDENNAVTQRNVRLRQKKPIIIPENAPEANIASNNATSLVFNANRLSRAVPVPPPLSLLLT